MRSLLDSLAGTGSVEHHQVGVVDSSRVSLLCGAGSVEHHQVGVIDC